MLALARPLRPDLAARALALGAAGTVSIEAGAPDLVKVLHDVAAGIARGLDNRAIGEELSISLNTVKTVIRAAYGRIGVTTRSQAVCWAIQHGYGPGEPAPR